MKKTLSLFWVTIILTSSLSAITPPELDSYFTRFKRGIHCIIHRKPCKADDKKVVYQVGGTLLLFLTIAAGKWLSVQENIINPFLTAEKRELVKQNREISFLPPTEQAIARNEYFLDAVENSDLPSVQFWLTHGANPNANLDYHYRQIINKGKVIMHPGRILNTALYLFSLYSQQSDPYITHKAKQVLLTLLKEATIDPRLPHYGTSVPLYTWHIQEVPYSFVTEKETREAMEEAVKRAEERDQKSR